MKKIYRHLDQVYSVETVRYLYNTICSKYIFNLQVKVKHRFYGDAIDIAVPVVC